MTTKDSAVSGTVSRRNGSKARGPRRPFLYQQGVLGSNGVALDRLAKRFGTPLYVYDREGIEAAWREYDQAFAASPHVICASVKANGNLAVLEAMARLGSGFDIVSGGELLRVLKAGGDPGQVVFSGVGKTAAEMDQALDAGILLFNVESQPELELLAERARRRKVKARFGVRVNPDVAAETHPHIATGLHRHKFGLTLEAAAQLYRESLRRPWLEAAGISFHIGSQILDTEPFGEAVARVAALVKQLRAEGLPIRYFDIGGGLGIAYRNDQTAPSVQVYAKAVEHALKGLDCCLLMEPGRRLVAAAGALVTEVLYIKENAGRTFVITDAGNNDLIRPTLYSAYHEIVPVKKPGKAVHRVDIVGPICETGDAFARDRELAPVAAGDLLAILDAGAYGFSLASNYNSRCRPAEVLIEKGKARLVRRREVLDDLLAEELPYVRGGKRKK